MVLGTVARIVVEASIDEFEVLLCGFDRCSIVNTLSTITMHLCGYLMTKTEMYSESIYCGSGW